MPYLYRDGEHMWKVLNGEIGQGLLADIQTSGSGLVGLAYYDAGSRNFYTKKPVKSLADMAGLKIRMQNNQMMVRMVELLGANGVTGIGPNDVYSAITQGTIDGAENNWPTYESMGDYEAAPYFLLDGHTRVPEILLASESVMKKLDPADVQIIKQVAKETQAFEIQKWAEREESSKAKVVAAGSVVTELTAAQLAEFQAKMAPLYDEYGKSYMDVITAIQNVK
jgi:TRAP-type C4-dicarboxylate transport system substrate-binding protein